MRIYLSVIVLISCLLYSSACKRSGASGANPHKKKYQNNASAGSSRFSKNKKEGKEKNKTKDKEKHSSAIEASDQAQKLIQTARGYAGTPYKYGGTSRSGLDCSGLTSIAYRSIGLTIPRTSQAQSTVGNEINLKDIQPGDLVFFADHKNGKKISHVGIITEVWEDGAQFIHSSTSLGVVENELLSGYYYPLIVKVRRVL
jgi:probable lipoprotein NlpC